MSLFPFLYLPVLSPFHSHGLEHLLISQRVLESKYVSKDGLRDAIFFLHLTDDGQPRPATIFFFMSESHFLTLLCSSSRELKYVLLLEDTPNFFFGGGVFRAINMLIVSDWEATIYCLYSLTLCLSISLTVCLSLTLSLLPLSPLFPLSPSPSLSLSLSLYLAPHPLEIN